MILICLFPNFYSYQTVSNILSKELTDLMTNLTRGIEPIMAQGYRPQSLLFTTVDLKDQVGD